MNYMNTISLKQKQNIYASRIPVRALTECSRQAGALLLLVVVAVVLVLVVYQY